MDWLKRGELTIAVLFMVIVIFFMATSSPNITGGTIVGNTIQEGYCVDVAVTDINPSSVGVNEDFTVGILIDNCGELISEDVTFEITKVSPFITIKEPLIQNIGKMGYANSERFLVYHMRTNNNIKPGDYVINYKLTYGDKSVQYIKEGNIEITVVAEEAELSIASIKTDPILPVKGDTVELTLRVENYGEGVANSIRVYANHSFRGIKESFIGTLNPDEDGPAIFTFIADKSGEFRIPITISYQDDFGEKQIETDVSFNILKKKSNILGMFLVLLVIVAFVAGIYYFLRTKKQKDDVIHQLLTGNNSGEKKKKS